MFYMASALPLGLDLEPLSTIPVILDESYLGKSAFLDSLCSLDNFKLKIL